MATATETLLDAARAMCPDDNNQGNFYEDNGFVFRTCCFASYRNWPNPPEHHSRDCRAVALQAALDAYEADAIGRVALRLDAERHRFCLLHGVFPVRDQSSESWVMFVAVTSRRRSSFFGETANEAIDAAMAAAGEQS